VMVAPGHCSPSRRVVSNMMTRSLSDLVTLVMGDFLVAGALPVRALKGFFRSRLTPECPGANRPDGPQGPIRSRSPPRSRVGRDAAGIARAPTALAVSPRTPYFSLRISIARPCGKHILGQNH